MKRMTVIICGLLVLALSPVAYAGPPVQNKTATLTLTNKSEETICFVQIAPTTVDDWGEKQLGALPDETITFDLEPDEYNIRLWDCANNILLEEHDITITNSYTLEFAEPVGGNCNDINQAGMSFY